jgi:hypothetical protein
MKYLTFIKYLFPYFGVCTLSQQEIYSIIVVNYSSHNSLIIQFLKCIISFRLKLYIKKEKHVNKSRANLKLCENEFV